MKKLIKKFLVSGIAAVLLAVASTGIVSACTAGLYQPELPEE
ncbi:cyclic lactone autoinducer peptide [Halanaerobaculum tunisiense]